MHGLFEAWEVQVAVSKLRRFSPRMQLKYSEYSQPSFPPRYRHHSDPEIHELLPERTCGVKVKL